MISIIFITIGSCTKKDDQILTASAATPTSKFNIKYYNKSVSDYDFSKAGIASISFEQMARMVQISTAPSKYEYSGSTRVLYSNGSYSNISDTFLSSIKYQDNKYQIEYTYENYSGYLYTKYITNYRSGSSKYFTITFSQEKRLNPFYIEAYLCDSNGNNMIPYWGMDFEERPEFSSTNSGSSTTYRSTKGFEINQNALTEWFSSNSLAPYLMIPDNPFRYVSNNELVFPELEPPTPITLTPSEVTFSDVVGARPPTQPTEIDISGGYLDGHLTFKWETDPVNISAEVSGRKIILWFDPKREYVGDIIGTLTSSSSDSSTVFQATLTVHVNVVTEYLVEITGGYNLKDSLNMSYFPSEYQTYTINAYGSVGGVIYESVTFVRQSNGQVVMRYGETTVYDGSKWTDSRYKVIYFYNQSVPDWYDDFLGFNDDGGIDNQYSAAFDAGAQLGYQSGYHDGHQIGVSEGYTQGSAEGYEQGYQQAITDGYGAGSLWYGAITLMQAFFKGATMFFQTKIIGDMTVGLFVIGIPATFMIIDLGISFVKKILGKSGGSSADE